ncbi:hypothetical protein GGR57DRAFT_461901 [Xylariaceae sp. FL1272]|nr:hypothetical protein GGR57DRAFT_461901 [Xylariaceae sp. FL1272]
MGKWRVAVICACAYTVDGDYRIGISGIWSCYEVKWCLLPLSLLNTCKKIIVVRLCGLAIGIEYCNNKRLLPEM